MALDTGWSNGQFDRITEHIKHWPQSLKRDAGFAYNREASPDSTDIEIELMRSIDSLFSAIAHGDDVHRAWLKQAIEDHFAGREVKRP